MSEKNQKNVPNSTKKSSYWWLIGLLLIGVLIIFGGGVVARPAIESELNRQASALPEFLQTETLRSWLEEPKSDSNQEFSSKLSELLQQDEVSIPDIVEAASDSVVTVSIKSQRRRLDSTGGILNFGPFGLQIPQQEERVEEIQQDIGTGFIVDSGEGVVVTNRHVVSSRDGEYLVFDNENNEYAVTRIYRDPTNDLAILQVEGLRKSALPLGDSDQIRVGESVIAIGTALGEFRNTVTTGVISGLGRGITAGDGFSMSEELENVIQTDAAINPGNSGGPLLGLDGRVVGVNVAVSQSANNIGFALPINVVKSVLENFNTTGQFERPFLGVSYRMITERAALMNEVPQGALIDEVVSGSSAEVAGLQVGDIVVSINGKKMKDEQLAEVVNALKIGDKVTIAYWRDGEVQTIEVELKVRPEGV